MQELFNATVLLIEFVGVGTVIASLKGVLKLRREHREEMATIKEGQKCQLRSDMLRIYYHNKDQKTIRQYELENFITLYQAYKLLRGNSFIDKVYEEVLTWEVIS